MKEPLKYQFNFAVSIEDIRVQTMNWKNPTFRSPFATRHQFHTCHILPEACALNSRASNVSVMLLLPWALRNVGLFFDVNVATLCARWTINCGVKLSKLRSKRVNGTTRTKTSFRHSSWGGLLVASNESPKLAKLTPGTRRRLVRPLGKDD